MVAVNVQPIDINATARHGGVVRADVICPVAEMAVGRSCAARLNLFAARRARAACSSTRGKPCTSQTEAPETATFSSSKATRPRSR